MKTRSFCKRVKTTCAPEFIDITDWVAECVAESQISIRLKIFDMNRSFPIFPEISSKMRKFWRSIITHNIYSIFFIPKIVWIRGKRYDRKA